MKIYNIQASKSFLRSLILGMIEKFGTEPEKMAKIKVFLPTKKSCSMFDEIFLEMMSFNPCIIPKTYPIGDLDPGEISLYHFINNEPEFIQNFKTPISEFEQKIILVKLIQKYSPENKASYKKNLNLAESLIDFYHDFKRDEVDFSKIQTLEIADISGYFAKMLDFLKIVTNEYPKYLDETNKTDLILYRNNLINSLSNAWQKNPEKNITIIAGSTGSVEVTRKLIKTIRSLENGYVVLPSIDQTLSNEIWDCIDKTHPQYILKRTMEYLDVSRKDIIEWDGQVNNEQNADFISYFMYPVAATHNWHLISKNISIDNFKLVECDNLLHEALTISLIIKDAIHKKNTILIVSNNDDLNNKIRIYLQRWNIFVSNSAGIKLLNTNNGKLFYHTAKLFESNFSATETLALLKHDFINFPNINEFEKIVFRGFTLKNGIKSIYKKLEDYPELSLQFQNIINKGNDFFESCRKTSLFKDILINHIKFVEEISLSKISIYENDEGEILYKALEELLSYANSIGTVSFQEYLEILENFLSNKVFQEKDSRHNNIQILNPVEARHIDADLVILSGLNESVWPANIATSPWLNKKMREELGLSSLDLITSLSAHDFYKLCHMKSVILTHSNYADSSPIAPSRWILRIKALANHLSLQNNLKTIEPWAKWAKEFDFTVKNVQYLPPAPKPDIKLRPRKLSVTQIEKLIRNPYTIYASEILKLKTIDPLEKEPGNADFGNFVHKVLDLYNKNYPKITTSKEEYLIQIGAKYIKEYKEYNLYHFWWGRFTNIAKNFINYDENARKNKKIFSESSGKFTFELANGPFTIKAKADRIEIDADNNINIIDFKTGMIPTIHDSMNFISPQLALEAVIALKNSFECLDKDANYKVTGLSYIPLQASHNSLSNITNLFDKNLDANEFIKQTSWSLYNLIVKYDNKSEPYTAYPDKKIAPFHDDYKHLSRIKEFL